ncbi:MAG: hypothetical protein ACKVOA_09660 [Methylophilaceae bacterium]
MSLSKVPKPYLGMWRRSLLEQAGVSDTTTTVLVIQTEQYHADIRVPAARPDFKETKHLEDCCEEQLSWLATQQGFTGITQIKGNVSQWLRDYDYQPFNHQRDIGEMRFESEDVLVETGVDAEYLEIWNRVLDSNLNLSVSLVMGEDRHQTQVPARLFTANNYFAYVRPRTAQLPIAASMAEAIKQHKPSPETLLDWLDFEISFGEIKDKAHGVITLSTMPFKEGNEVALS